MASPDVESVSWLRFAFASTTVVGLMALLAWGLKYFAARGLLVANKNNNRLKIVSTLTLDARRRLVIAKCDESEYLLLLGPSNDLLLSPTALSSTSEKNQSP